MADSITSHGQYTFVTVAYCDDFGLMRLQARSLEKYLDPKLAAQIIVIENPQMGSVPNWGERLIREYGSLVQKVRFVNGREIANVPKTVSGWFSQQNLKVMVSAGCLADR